MKRKKTGVRSPRKTSARPTRTPASRAVKAPGHQERSKLREGGRQSSPFSTGWKYLDTVGERTTPKAAATDRGGAGKTDKGKRSQTRSPNAVRATSRTLTYFEPTVPFLKRTERDVMDWFLAKPGAYRLGIVNAVNTWKWFNANGRDNQKLVRGEHEQAVANATPPSSAEIVAHLKTMATPACSCGFDGNPYEAHKLDATKRCLRDFPSQLKDDDDDDLPF